jgi:hypothetical protein
VYSRNSLFKKTPQECSRRKRGCRRTIAPLEGCDLCIKHNIKCVLRPRATSRSSSAAGGSAPLLKKKRCCTPQSGSDAASCTSTLDAAEDELLVATVPRDVKPLLVTQVQEELQLRPFSGHVLLSTPLAAATAAAAAPLAPLPPLVVASANKLPLWWIPPQGARLRVFPLPRIVAAPSSFVTPVTPAERYEVLSRILGGEDL